jgi:hypothetical protein
MLTVAAGISPSAQQQTMDKEHVVHMHSGVLFRYKEWSHVICRKMVELDITILNKVTLRKSIACVFSHMWNLGKE